MSLLEKRLLTASEELASLTTAEPIFQQASHAERLEESEDWALTVGTGYKKGSQQTSLIYKHLSKLMGAMRSITGGDAMKAKQLSDLLSFRTHAGVLRFLAHHPFPSCSRMQLMSTHVVSSFICGVRS